MLVDYDSMNEYMIPVPAFSILIGAVVMEIQRVVVGIQGAVVE